ncbi:MAG: amino acid permease [Frankiales bacterium]|nr:amino acid permease [Frankiales bacterium]
MTLTREERRPPRWLPVLGLLGCIVLAVSLPVTSILTGAEVLLLGAIVWAGRHRFPTSDAN